MGCFSPADLSTQLVTLGATSWRLVSRVGEARMSHAVLMEQLRIIEWWRRNVMLLYAELSESLMLSC